MDSWEWNKYAAAILSALVFVLAVHFSANMVFSVSAPVKPVYAPPPPAKTQTSAPTPDAAPDAAPNAAPAGDKTPGADTPGAGKKA